MLNINNRYGTPIVFYKGNIIFGIAKSYHSISITSHGQKYPFLMVHVGKHTDCTQNSNECTSDKFISCFLSGLLC